MTTNEWFTEADAVKDKIRSLIERYHPVNRLPGGTDLPITAHNAENACIHVRQNIRKNFEGNPVRLWQEALDTKDISLAMTLLNDTWFGVPESTLCWGIMGFREAIRLLDDPPDDEGI